jgi:4'-phosphopantetheinyl transferase
MFKKLPIVDVYVAEIPAEGKLGKVYPRSRQEEIKAVKNEKVKREKYYVWKLLEIAIEKSLGFSASNMEFYKDKNGKWHSPTCKFSLSHSAGALAVAVSDGNVGVDIERIKIKYPERASEYILTPKELCEYRLLREDERVEHLVFKWCQKEASFKLFGGEAYKPSSIELDGIFLDSRKLELENERYVLAVATDKKEDIRLFEEKI